MTTEETFTPADYQHLNVHNRMRVEHWLLEHGLDYHGVTRIVKTEKAHPGEPVQWLFKVFSLTRDQDGKIKTVSIGGETNVETMETRFSDTLPDWWPETGVGRL